MKLILHVCCQGRSPPPKGIYQRARGLGQSQATPVHKYVPITVTDSYSITNSFMMAKHKQGLFSHDESDIC